VEVAARIGEVVLDVDDHQGRFLVVIDHDSQATWGQ
jgi:hypothetical protein